MLRLHHLFLILLRIFNPVRIFVECPEGQQLFFHLMIILTHLQLTKMHYLCQYLFLLLDSGFSSRKLPFINASFFTLVHRLVCISLRCPRYDSAVIECPAIAGCIEITRNHSDTLNVHNPVVECPNEVRIYRDNRLK
jgi:hypothetical protein